MTSLEVSARYRCQGRNIFAIRKPIRIADLTLLISDGQANQGSARNGMKLSESVGFCKQDFVEMRDVCDLTGMIGNLEILFL